MKMLLLDAAAAAAERIIQIHDYLLGLQKSATFLGAFQNKRQSIRWSIHLDIVQVVVYVQITTGAIGFRMFHFKFFHL
jgi:hypothetical protein